MPKFVYFILSPIFAFLSLGYGLAWIPLLRQMIVHIERYDTVLFGMICYGALYVLLIRKMASRFWQTFDHEFTHTIFALLFFRRIAAFKVSNQEGGYMQHEGNSNFMIALAPYFFPTFAVFALLARIVVHPEIRPYLDFAIGFLLMYDLLALFEEAHLAQPDLQRHGAFFSYSVILCFYLAMLGSILMYIGFGSSATLDFIQDGFLNLLALFRN